MRNTCLLVKAPSVIWPTRVLKNKVLKIPLQGIHWPTKDEPDREAQELATASSRLAATMDSDEEDSAEEDDEGGSPTGTDNGIFDDGDPGFEGEAIT